MNTLTLNNTGSCDSNGIPLWSGYSTIGTGVSITTGGNTTGNYLTVDTTTTFTNWETAEFNGLDEKLNSLLSTSYKEIVDNFICFYVYVDGKEVKPIDDILKMINKKEVFDLKMSRSGYDLFINNCRFKKIKNLIESSAKEYIKVEFDYESMEYNNNLKTDLDKRKDKMELLKHKIENK